MTVYLRKGKDTAWLLPLKVTPNAARNEWLTMSETDECLKVKLNAAPEKGKANQALVAFLSASFGLPKSQVTVIRGETARLKQVAVMAPWSPDEWRLRLSALVAGQPEWFQFPE